MNNTDSMRTFEMMIIGSVHQTTCHKGSTVIQIPVFSDSIYTSLKYLSLYIFAWLLNSPKIGLLRGHCHGKDHNRGLSNHIGTRQFDFKSWVKYINYTLLYTGV